MKIALSVASMSVGGIATFILNLSQSLCQAGHEVTVIAQRHGEWWPRLTESRVTGYCLPRQRWESMPQAAQRFAAYLTAQQVDLLLVNIGIDNRLPMFALHLLPDSMPVVLALRNDRPEVYDLAAVNLPAWNCAVGVSPKVQQDAQARFGQKAIRQISNGILVPSTEQMAARTPWSIPLRLLFVGRLDDHQKGIFRLPAILAACRTRQIPVQLSVIGDGPDRTQLLQLLTATGSGDRVQLCSFQAHDAVLAAMRTHHILLMPSNFEGLPNVLLEAQANGCVPIAARLPGITDLALKEGVSGILVSPDDVSGYVNGIEKLLAPAQWRAFCAAGIALMQQHQSLQSMGERYLTLFEDARRGVYPLAIARSRLRQQGISPFRWRDYLPQSVRCRLQKTTLPVVKLKRQIAKWA